MTEKCFTITLSKLLVVENAHGEFNRNSNGTQWFEAILNGWKLNESEALYVYFERDGISVGPLQLFFDGHERYSTLAPPELLCVAGNWKYSIELRYNSREDGNGELKYESITSDIKTLSIKDTIAAASPLNSYSKEIELLTAAKVIANSRAVYSWHSTYTYDLGEIVYCESGNQFGAFVKSTTPDNKGNPPYDAQGVLDAAHWETVLDFNQLTKAIVIWGFNQATDISDLEWEVQ